MTPPLAEFICEAPLCQAPIRISRARRATDGLPALVYEVVGASLSTSVLSRYRQSSLLAVSNTPVGALIAVAADGVPLCGLNLPVEIGDFLSLAEKCVQALGEVQDKSGVYRHLSDASIWDSSEGEVHLLPPPAAAFLDECLASLAEVEHPGARLWPLRYMAPEETGRMNVSPDTRADLYSLGVLFYQLLTGKLPFESDDALELVHSHLARQAVPPHEINSAIPEAVAFIVLKLLAKTPEERYQGTYGLRADLRECARQWAESARIETFPLGSQDIAEQLTLRAKIYGRDAELGTLIHHYEDVRATGRSRVVLIGGYSGVGKSALASAIKNTVAQSGGYFISGKVDQFRRNLPYASIAEAFRGLVRQLQTEKETRIVQLGDELRRALGGYGQLIVEVVPEIEHIIGPQPEITATTAQEAAQRFNTAFQAFLSVITEPGRPLVLFLDDLQWMDAASLRLMEVLLSGTSNLLFLGAYRDNEVSPSHPLCATIARLEAENNGRISQLTLLPLPQSSVTELLSDALHTQPDHVQSLAQLLVSKTDGNALFLLQFLQALHTDGLLAFDRNHGRWVWDNERIQRADLSGDVVELMAGKIRKFSEAGRTAIQVAACLGNRFELDLLAQVQEQESNAVLAALREAREAGLIFAVEDEVELAGGKFQFLHDRVQQAAYHLVPENERVQWHDRIAHVLLDSARRAGPAVLDDHIFEIANHLNLGWSGSRLELARINLRAAQKAKQALAYESARRYALSGVQALPPAAWASQHELALELNLTASECEILLGKFAPAEVRLQSLLKVLRDRQERARVYLLQLTSLTTQTRMAEAAEVGVQALAEFGHHIPLHPGKSAIISEVVQARKNLGFRKPEDLLASPRMSDPDAVAAVQIVGVTLAAAFQFDVLLWTLLTLKTVSLSLRFGIAESTPIAFANYAIVLCAPLGQFHTGLQFSRVARELSERREYSLSRSPVYFTSGAFVHFWHYPMADGIALMQRSYESGQQSGEFVFASYSTLHIVLHRLFKGDHLNDVQQVTEQYLDFVHRVQYKEGPEYLQLFRQYIACLQGRTTALDSFTDEAYDEPKHVQEMQGYINILPLTYYTVLKLEALYLSGKTDQALRLASWYASKPKRVEQFSSMLFGPLFHFYHAMSMAAAYPKALTRQRRAHRLALEVNLRRFQKWAQGCEANFSHLHAILLAELFRLQGDWQKAHRQYETGITLAEKFGFVHHAALAHERAGTMHLELGSPVLAGYHFAQARERYSRWGATAKVRQLEQRYADLLPPEKALTVLEEIREPATIPASPATGESVSTNLDLGTVIKASQAISGEIEWTRLLRVLMNIAMENAGAQRGVLLVDQNGELRLAAEGHAGSVRVQPLEGSVLTGEQVPLSVVNYVARTRESVVLSDAGAAELFSSDPFVTHNRTRSVLCTPIVNQGRLVGVLYLENNLAEGAFTEDRLRLLTLLAAQAAVSLEAARAYSQVRTSQNQLQSILDNANTVAYMKDLQGRYIVINEQFIRLFGVTKADIIGRTDAELLPPETARRFEEEDASVIREGRTWEQEETVPINGEARTYLTVKFPLYDAEGKLYAIAGVSTDISERKRAEQVLENYSHALEEQVAERTLELLQKNDELQKTLDQLQDAKQRMVLQENLAYLGTLTAGVAHEIQNPLNFVINFAQISTMLVQDLGGQLDEIKERVEAPQYKYVLETVQDLELNAAKINEHGQRIDRIVRSMLLHSRGISPPPSPTLLNQLLEESADLVYHAQRVENPDFHVHLEKVLDPALSTTKVDVVAQDLSRVFTNIIGNAAYAVRKKQSQETSTFEPLIRLKTQVVEGGVEVRIRDNGGGIPKGVREEIFKPFFTTKPTGEGTGLGLSICFDIVAREHGGDLRVESLTDEEVGNSGQGYAEFIISLPANPDKA